MSSDEETPVVISASELGLQVQYCPMCSLPPEYCEFGPKFKKQCKPWMMKNRPELLKGKLTQEEEEMVEKLSLAAKEEGGDDRKEDTEPENKADEKAQVWISRMARKGNKNVTVVFHLEKFGLNPKKVAKQFQSKFACGSSVQKGPPLSVLVQGDVSEDVADFLVHKFKVPAAQVYMYNLKKKVATRAFDDDDEDDE